MLPSERCAHWVLLLATFFDSAAHTAAFAPSTAFRSFHQNSAFIPSGSLLPLACPRRLPARTVRLRMAAEESQAGGLSDADISGLLARVSAAKDRVQTMPLFVLDATLPRQRLQFATDDISFSALLAYCKEAAGGDGLGKFGMLGSSPAFPFPCLMIY